MPQQSDHFRSSTSGWLRGTLAGWATILLAVAGIGASLSGVWGLWPLLATALALVIAAWKWVENMSASYAVVEDRLIIRRGIFMKSIDEVELYRVKDIRLDFSLINQWAGIGTLCIGSSDETTRGGALVIRHVEHAESRREALRRLVEAARQKRRVREIDMMHEDI
ncbi:MAG TPA: PH domain-containing protein [Allosphingosinicella sp.]|jgi:uncharacterized membrane protein YdbT with pleckstrin-like domain